MSSVKGRGKLIVRGSSRRLDDRMMVVESQATKGRKVFRHDSQKLGEGRRLGREEGESDRRRPSSSSSSFPFPCATPRSRASCTLLPLMQRRKGASRSFLPSAAETLTSERESFRTRNKQTHRASVALGCSSPTRRLWGIVARRVPAGEGAKRHRKAIWVNANEQRGRRRQADLHVRRAPSFGEEKSFFVPFSDEGILG